MQKKEEEPALPMYHVLEGPTVLEAPPQSQEMEVYTTMR